VRRWLAKEAALCRRGNQSLTKGQAKLPRIFFVDEGIFDAGAEYVDREVIKAIVAAPITAQLELPFELLISQPLSNQSCA
jgi:hypothetical protein